jgi:hypothetical protein
MQHQQNAQNPLQSTTQKCSGKSTKKAQAAPATNGSRYDAETAKFKASTANAATNTRKNDP